MPPLEAGGSVDDDDQDNYTMDPGPSSDHKIVYVTVKMPRIEAFTWESYTYSHYNNESVEDFKKWIVFHEWGEVLASATSDSKVNAYQKTITEAIERFFPLKKHGGSQVTSHGSTKK